MPDWVEQNISTMNTLTLFGSSTQFQFGKQLIDGPNVDNVVDTDCGCSTYFDCHYQMYFIKNFELLRGLQVTSDCLV